MSLRLPQSLAPGRSAAQTGLDIFTHELAAERAATLGRAGHKVETTLAALRAFDVDGGGGPEARLDLVKACADAVWAFFIQRELMGLRDQRAVTAQYGIPREVLVRLGAR